MRVVLHIGSNKTGTTSLQRAFHRGRRTLGREGVLYPGSPDGGPTHALLLAGLYHPGHVPRLERHRPKSPRDRERLLDDIRSKVREARPRVLVLSSEGFFRPLADGALRRLREELLGLGADRVEVAVYLRRPSDKYLSSLQQAIKASSTFPAPGPSSYRQVLEPYVEAFGQDAVRARPFSPAALAGGDIIEDFCQSYLGDAFPRLAALLPRFRTNETLSAESMDLLLRFRQAFHPGDDGRFASDSNALARTLLRLDASLGAARPRLRPAVAAGIDAASAGDLAWVASSLGVAFPSAEDDPGLPPSPALADLVAVDAALRQSLLRALLRSGWALNPGWGGARGWLRGAPLLPRRSWIRGLLQSPDPDPTFRPLP